MYFAFRCLDSEPGKIRTNITRRDNAFGDDWVGVSLDSSRAGQLAYHLFVNPSGIQMDALQSGSGGEDFAPDWVWQSAGHVGADGWSAEIRVPLENIRFRSGADVRMGVLFWRRLSRTGVSASWPAMAPSKWVFESNAVVSFDELQSRRLFEMIPSATFSGNQIRSDRSRWNATRARGDVGVSVKYGLSSAVTLDATVNPDFSQVESDAFEVEVNQRFPVFFSEKRPFFMEGMGLFNIAGTGGDSTMRTAVHTRKIIDPSAGLKLTGAQGRHTFGVLSSADAAPPGERQRAFTVGREVMNFGRGQYAGLLVSDTEYGNDHNRVVGGDVAFKQGEHFQGNASYLFSSSRTLEGQSSQGRGTQASYDYSTQRFTIAGQAEHYDTRVPDGHRVHQPRRCHARVAISGAEFLSIPSGVQVDQAHQPVRLGLGCRRSQSDGNRNLLSACRAFQLHPLRIFACRLRNRPRNVRRTEVRDWPRDD